jgi:hypothetical protein
MTSGDVGSSSATEPDDIETTDEVKLTDRVENPADAKLKANAALEDANNKRYEGQIEIEGNPLFVAGNTVTVTGVGKLDGNYLIESSKHTMLRDGGYTTVVEVNRA